MSYTLKGFLFTLLFLESLLIVDLHVLYLDDLFDSLVHRLFQVLNLHLFRGQKEALIRCLISRAQSNLYLSRGFKLYLSWLCVR